MGNFDHVKRRSKDIGTRGNGRRKVGNGGWGSRDDKSCRKGKKRGSVLFVFF